MTLLLLSKRFEIPEIPLFFCDRLGSCLQALSLGVAFLLPLSASAQVQQGLQNTNSVTTYSTNYIIGEIGANHRVWQKVVPAFTNQSGQVNYQTNSYTELATGMNFFNNGLWTASSETIQITAGGGAATNGQHQVYFTANINASNAVQITTPDGLQLNSHIMGLSFYDSATGSNVLFAVLRDSTGQLVANNQVVFPNAFTDCDADVRYTYTRDGSEQDIVVHQQLPIPESFGLNPDTTWLQVWTEFYDPPTPAIEQILDGTDERLDFGIMKMERGKAFIMGNESNSVPVNKSWRTVQNRTFLVEQVQFDDVAAQLQSLPAYSSGGGGTNGTGTQQIRYEGFPRKLPPAPTLVKRASEKLKLAGTQRPEKGLVLDYVLKNGSITNLTFAGDTTYYITGNVNLYSNTVIEGGTVVKFTNSGPTIAFFGPVNCETGPYQMAVFTAGDDNTVGSSISGSTGIPTNYYAGTALADSYSGGSNTFQYLRILYATTAFALDASHTDTFKHCQFVNDYIVADVPEGALNLENVLADNIAKEVVEGLNSTSTTAINMTVDQAGQIFFCPSGPPAGFLSVTNCLFAAITNAGNSYSAAYSYTNLSDPGVFQTAGAGNYYLAAGSPYRDVGTTNIDPALLNDLRNLTTYPPICPPDFNHGYVNALTQNMTWNPQAQRDYDTPDLGYHYAPIDYMTVNDYSNCTATLTNGVVWGYFCNVGISLDNYGALVSQGSPLQRNVIAYYALVQEQPIKLTFGDTNLSDYPIYSFPITTWHPNASQTPSISLRFTSIYAPQVALHIMYTSGNYAISSLTMRDCESYGSGAAFDWYQQTGPVSLINNYFQYTQVYGDATGRFDAYNNLYRGTSGYEFQDFNGGGATITNRDNAFDATTANLGGTIGYNAYLNGATDGNTHTAGDIFTNLTWVIGPLGNYYQATNSPLITNGSPAASQLGLYHYTVTTNEVVEGTNIVTIGYHYVALGTNGLPLDTNGDGIPDYLEDANGNGVVNSGEISWTNSGDLGLQVLITQPPNNSILP